MKKPFLEAGEFVTTHGITGELRLYPWCDGPGFLSGFTKLYLDENGKKHLKVKIRPHKNMCIVKIEDVDTIEQARAYIGKTTWISRQEADLPAGRWFVQDIIGACVKDADTGEEYGCISSVTHPGSHDVFEIKRPDGSISLFPAVEPFLCELDVDGEQVKVRPIPGMFDGEDGK